MRGWRGFALAAFQEGLEVAKWETRAAFAGPAFRLRSYASCKCSWLLTHEKLLCALVGSN